MQRGTAIVHINHALGAGFAQYTAELEAGGLLAPASLQRFVYILSGTITIEDAALSTGAYAFTPQNYPRPIHAITEARLLVIEKPYQALPHIPAPSFLTGREFEIASAALMGDESVQARSLLPGDPAFDFAVNVMTYQPGASLSMVEIHVMEHGLLMLEGGGIYRLDEDWHAVTAGNFIWMAPYCPQWFGALGRKPAKYIIYKDWNRHPL
jgi:(S)-ureidoglycine aminohydrolase